jgi:inner membrane protease ATP23
MLKHLGHAGANTTPAHFPCLPCDLTHSGGFSPDAGSVMLCQGNFLNKKHMEHTIVHELVHMYDHAVFNVDWTNLRHHACSEVRSYHAILQ